MSLFTKPPAALYGTVIVIVPAIPVVRSSPSVVDTPFAEQIIVSLVPSVPGVPTAS